MTISNVLSYLKILLQIKIIRAVYATSQFLTKYTGKRLLSSTPPFETIYVRSTKSPRRIRVDVYRTNAALRPDVGPVAVHLNWHGSGFVVPAFGESRPYIEYLLKHKVLSFYPLAIFDCDYAKAPEYPCPAATDDARDVLDYVFKHSSVYDSQKVTMGGFSAGGEIALGLSAKIGMEAENFTSHQPSIPSSLEHPIKAVIAFYPPTTWEQNRAVPSIPKGATFPGFLPTKDLTDAFDAAYFFPHTFDLDPSSTANLQRVQAMQQEPLLCPTAANNRDYPKHIALITVEYDTLTQDTEEFRKKLEQDQGKKVYGWKVPKVAHAWDVAVLPGQYGFEERATSYDLAAKVIARAGGAHIDI